MVSVAVLFCLAGRVARAPRPAPPRHTTQMLGCVRGRVGSRRPNKKERNPGILDGIEKACVDSKTVLAMALAYHTRYVKMPMAKGRQS